MHVKFPAYNWSTVSSSNNGSKADPKILLRGALTTAGLSMYAPKLKPAACVSSASMSASRSLTVKRDAVADWHGHVFERHEPL